MIYQNVGEIYEAIDKTRNHLKQKVSGLTSEQHAARQDADEKQWSVGEIVEHLATVEAGILRIIDKLLGSADDENVKWNGTFDAPLSFVEKALGAKDQKFEAPKMIHPTGAQTITDSLAKLEENRRLLVEMRARLEAVDVSSATFPHPFFGALNAYEWLVVVGLHERRHLAQIERIFAESE